MRALSPHEQSVVEIARDFGDTVIGPNAEAWDKLGRVPEEVFKQAAERGLCRLLVPAALGGSALSVTALVSVMQTLASHCFASTFSLVVHQQPGREHRPKCQPRAAATRIAGVDGRHVGGCFPPHRASGWQ